MATKKFRAGVATVIFNDNHEVALFKRAKPPVGFWEFQQGGIDEKEDTLDTLWRELKEEVGLTENELELVAEYPEWLAYEKTCGHRTGSCMLLDQFIGGFS